MAKKNFIEYLQNPDTDRPALSAALRALIDDGIFFAELTVTGGTANAVQASLPDGVLFEQVQVFYIDIGTPNAGNVTISVDGATPIPALDYDGAQFAAGAWDGRLLLSNEGAALQSIIDRNTAVLAAQYAAQAEQSADLAGDKADAAEQSRQDAANEAGSAAGSATLAGQNADDAAAILLAFDKRYLGSKVADPATDNQGQPLLTGAQYFNETSDSLRIWDGAAWVVVGGIEVVEESDLDAALTMAMARIAYSVAQLKAIDTTRYNVAYLSSGGRSGVFTWVAGDFTALIASDTLGAIYMKADAVAASEGAWVRQYTGAVNIAWFGVSTASANNTAAYTAAISMLADGTEIFWPNEPGIFVGNFNATSKAFKLRGNGAKVRDFTSNIPIISMIGTSAVVTNTNGTATYGAEGILLPSVAGLAIGDIMFFWDQKSSGGVFGNRELLKVKSFSGLTVEVADMFRSEQTSTPISCNKLTPINDPAIVGFEARPSNAHNTDVLSIQFAQQAEISQCVVRNSTGRAIDFRYCFGLRAMGNKILDARDFGSGNGYGVAISHCRNVSVHNTYGRALRHAVDLEGTYCGDVVNTTHEGDVAGNSLTVVVPIHDGYGGNLVIEGVYGWNVYAPAVQLSAQGLANPLGHVMRDMTIRTVRLRSQAPVTDTVIGVYVQASYANLVIEDVQVEVKTGAEALNTASSCCVRLGGQCHGFSLIQGLKSRRLMCGIFASVDGTVPGGMPFVGLLVIKDVYIAYCNHAVWARGVKSIETHTIAASSVVGAVRTIATPHNGITTSTNVTVGNAGAVA